MRFKFLLAVLAALFVAALLPVRADKTKTTYVWRVIVPVQIEEEVRKCPVCGAYMLEAKIQRNGATWMWHHLRKGLEGMEGCKFIFRPPVEDSESEEEKEKRKNLSKMIEEAKSRKASHLLIPVMLKHKELVGNAFAASSPASVGFHVHIVRVEDAVPTWNFLYDETQEPLSQNLPKIKKFWKRRGKWVKAEKLLIEGIEKLIKKYPECQAEKK